MPRAALVVVPLLAGASAGAQSYDPEGPQTSVDRVEVVEAGGWQHCFSSPYSAGTGIHLAAIQAGCAGERTMLSCGVADSAILTLLAQAPTADVTTNTGNNSTAVHEANGSRWYFHSDGTENGESGNAWGFAGPGTAIAKNNCDVEMTESPELRLCWHLNPPYGGYRCGSTDDLNEEATWTKYLHVWRSAIFEDGFESGGGDVCSWSASTAGGCAASASLTVGTGCGVAILDQGPHDLDPDSGSVGYRLSWTDLRREWGYRLQVDRDSNGFTAEDDWVELPAGTEDSGILSGDGSFQHTYRLLGHQKHLGGHGDEALADDVVSNACVVSAVYD